MVWSTNKALSITLGVLTLAAGALPAGVAYVGAQIVDAVIHAADLHRRTGTTFLTDVVRYVALEALLVAATAMAQRGISLAQSLLRAQLGQRVNVMILEKALTLDLTQFEDSEFYDKLTRARREASSRPLSLVMRTFGLGQNAVSLISFGGLLYRFSPWAVLLLVLAGLPAFLAEAKFSGEAFRLFRWRAPESRMQIYLESVLAREDYAKEVKLFDLGPRFLDRYRDIFTRLYREDRDLTLRRDAWGFGLGLLGTATLYGGYVWIAVETVLGAMTVGQMTMYLMLFRQGQSAVSAALVGGQRSVRGQSVPVESVRISRATRGPRQRAWPADRRTRSRATAFASRTWSSSIRAPRRRRCRESACTCAPAKAWRWWDKTAPEKPP